MSRQNRAAQFAPFAALTGFESSVAEAARLTDQKLTLTDKEAEILNQTLNLLCQNIAHRPEISVSYFVPDGKKSGGSYITHVGNLRVIDQTRRLLIFTDKTEILIDQILDIAPQ